MVDIFRPRRMLICEHRWLFSVLVTWHPTEAPVFPFGPDSLSTSHQQQNGMAPGPPLLRFRGQFFFHSLVHDFILVSTVSLGFSAGLQYPYGLVRVFG